MLYLNKIELDTELNRCMGCKAKPCEASCPVNCCPQEFIKFAKNKQYSEALKVIYENNPMGLTCGLICPHYFCMKSCLRSKVDTPIKIPLVQATLIHDHQNELFIQKPYQKNGKKIAVIGAGPAGIAAVWFLSKNGYSVDMYEMSSQIGGALNLIPQNRLPHDVIEADWNFVQQSGDIHVFFNHKIQNPLDLLSNYAGVIMAVGEQIPVNLNITGEEYVTSYIDYLKNAQSYNHNTVAVIGGGKVAFDCIGTALNNGAKEIHLIIRRRMSDLRMDPQEIQYMIEQNVKLHTNTLVKEVTSDKDLYGMTVSSSIIDNGKCIDTGNTTIMPTKFNVIIKAIGSRAEKPVEHEKIIYAGDCKTGGSTVVEAIASGIDAAKALHQKL